MVRIEVREANIHDAIDLAPRLRASDIDEIRAAHGVSGLAGLVLSMSASEFSFAGCIDGDVVAIFGIAAGDGYGAPWLLASNEIERRPVAFLRRNRRFIAAMKERHGVLRNHVDARHAVSVKWLRWLGFDIREPEPWGFEGRPFHPFVME